MGCFRKCFFNYDTLIAKTGNTHKGYEDLNCIKVPTFNIQVWEREDAGNGWFGGKELVTKTMDRVFIVMKDNKPHGVLINPYHQDFSIKSDILSLDSKFPQQVKDFIHQLNN